MKEQDKPQSNIITTIFGIIMIIVYVGMGVLLITNFFKWEPSWEWARLSIGILLIIYGIWRAVRQFMGIDRRYN